MENSIFQRHELKYLVTETQRGRLEEAFESCMVPDPHGESTICNVYYDTPDFRLIRASLEKPVYKEKLRLRCYGAPSSDESVVYFEIKSKLYGTVVKRRVEMKYGDALEYINSGKRPQTDIYINRQVLDEIDELRGRMQCKPRLIISYDRHAYFMKSDPAVRLTFDENIMMCRDDLDLSHYKGGAYLIPPDDLILEIKIPYAVPLWLSQALSEEGIFMTSFSKYGKEYKKRHSNKQESR